MAPVRNSEKWTTYTVVGILGIFYIGICQGCRYPPKRGTLRIFSPPTVCMNFLRLSSVVGMPEMLLDMIDGFFRNLRLLLVYSIICLNNRLSIRCQNVELDRLTALWTVSPFLTVYLLPGYTMLMILWINFKNSGESFLKSRNGFPEANNAW